MRSGASGKVYLVGAGPGDPELITLKAMRLIQSADIILYDRLVNNELLRHRAPHAQLIYCGKAPGAHTMSQTSIQQLLIRYARQGSSVVRLKGGDPLVFGRGAEEALELAEHGIDFEIVPGITSAIGAAAVTGIPLTHRGYSASFACVTGSRCHGGSPPIRWELLAHGIDTLTIYMGVSELPAIREQLLLHGKPASTPAALIENGTTSEQRIFTGTLSDIHLVAAANSLQNPAMIIIGEVVRIRGQLHSAQAQAMALMG